MAQQDQIPTAPVGKLTPLPQSGGGIGTPAVPQIDGHPYNWGNFDKDFPETPKAPVGKLTPLQNDIPQAPVGKLTPMNQPQQPGAMHQAWDWLNTGLISPEHIKDALFSAAHAFSPEMQLMGHQPSTGAEWEQRAQQLANQQIAAGHPVRAALEQFPVGVPQAEAEQASGLTSPLGIGTMALPGAEESLAAGGMVKSAKAVSRVGQVAGAGFAAQGSQQIYKGATDPNLNPWQRAEQIAQGGSNMLFGAAGVMAPSMHPPASGVGNMAVEGAGEPVSDAGVTGAREVGAKGTTPLEDQAKKISATVSGGVTGRGPDVKKTESVPAAVGPQDVAKKYGLQYRGEVSPGTGVHDFQHPDGGSFALRDKELGNDALIQQKLAERKAAIKPEELSPILQEKAKGFQERQAGPKEAKGIEQVPEANKPAWEAQNRDHVVSQMNEVLRNEKASPEEKRIANDILKFYKLPEKPQPRKVEVPKPTDTNISQATKQGMDRQMTARAQAAIAPKPVTETPKSVQMAGQVEELQKGQRALSGPSMPKGRFSKQTPEEMRADKELLERAQSTQTSTAAPEPVSGTKTLPPPAPPTKTIPRDTEPVREPAKESQVAATMPVAEAQKPVGARKSPIDPESRKYLETVRKQDPRVGRAMEVLNKKILELPKEMRDAVRASTAKTFADELKKGTPPLRASEAALGHINTKLKEGGFAGEGKKPTSAKTAYKTAVERLTTELSKLEPTEGDKAVAKGAEAGRRIAGGAGGFGSKMMELRGALKGMANWYMHPETGQKLSEALKDVRQQADWKDLIGQYSKSHQQASYHTDEFVKTIEKTIKDKGAREAITNYLQAGGDTDLLSKRAQAHSDRSLAAGYERATRLNETEKRAAQAIRSMFDDLFKEGRAMGILDHAWTNYVPQVWEKDSPFRRGLLSAIDNSKFQTNPSFAKQRFYDTYFEGENAGKTPKNKDVGFLVGNYVKSFQEAIAARKFAKGLFDGIATDGRPLAVPEGKIARVIKEGGEASAYAVSAHGKGRGRLLNIDLMDRLNIPYDEKTITENDKARTDTSDYKEINHPAFRKWAFSLKGPDGNPVFVESDARVHPDIAKRLEAIYTKSWFRENKPASLFMKGQSFVKQVILSVPAFHYVQEGWHATAHMVNPLDREIWSGQRLKEAMNDPIVEKGMQRGLMLYDRNMSINAAEGMTGLTKLPKVGAYLQMVQNHLFNTYIPGLKATMFKDALARNNKRYAGQVEAGKITKDQLTELTAAQANAAFGGLNYEWMGRDKTAQDVFRVAALAPDFLEARGRFVGQAIRPYGREQLMALGVRMGAAQYLLARTLNMVFNQGDPLLDPEYMFKVKHGERVYGLRSVTGDIQHMLKDTNSFLFYRESPSLRMLTQAGAKFFGGREMTLSDWFQENMPIAAQGEIKDMLTHNIKDKRALDNLLNSFGIQSAKYRTPEEREAIEQKEEKRQKSLRGERSGAGRSHFKLPGIKKPGGLPKL